jgi:hypothetical protein
VTRVKALAVDSSAQQGQVVHAQPTQFALLRRAGGQRHLGQVVEPAQIADRWSMQKPQSVMFAVLLKIGMKATDRRDAQTPGDP